MTMYDSQAGTYQQDDRAMKSPEVRRTECPPAQEAMDDLVNEIDRLEEAFARLVDRVGPVLGDSMPQDSPGEEKCLGSDVTRRLHAMGQRLRSLRHGVLAAADRVEV
jgi:hypothetical protein